MIDKTLMTAAAAIAQITDGATVMIGGFGTAGQPAELIDALIDHGARELTIVNNNAGNGDLGLAALLKAERVRKIICSFPRQADSYEFDKLYHAKKIELELVALALEKTPQEALRQLEKARQAQANLRKMRRQPPKK